MFSLFLIISLDIKVLIAKEVLNFRNIFHVCDLQIIVHSRHSDKVAGLPKQLYLTMKLLKFEWVKLSLYCFIFCAI